jgi:hypothetical protein
MHTLAQSDPPDFWAGCYCGRQIAILHRYGKWHVYLDHALQHNILFATAEDAIVWLTERIDHGAATRLQ